MTTVLFNKSYAGYKKNETVALRSAEAKRFIKQGVAVKAD